MAQDDFLPVATGGGANVEDQATYAADPVVPLGFGLNAIPPSKLWNKMLRQSSTIAAMVAAFLATSVGIAMIDDGNAATKLAAMNAAFRIKLQANTTFYVATGGNDANNGLTVGTPWATIQHAWNVISQNYDLAGYCATIQLADGTYTQTLQAFYGPPDLGRSSVAGAVGTPGIVINGNAVTPSNVVVQNGTSHVFSFQGFVFCQVQNLKMTTTGVGWDCIVSSTGACVLGTNLVFGACSGYHVQAETGSISLFGNITINGNAAGHVLAEHNGSISINATAYTLTGTPAFSNAFAVAQANGTIDTSVPNATFAGAATGPRYAANSNGVIYTNSAGASYLPGNSAGATSTGGQYI